MSLGGRGSAHRATVVRALGHGKHHALSEALAESAYAGQGKPDFCVSPYAARFSAGARGERKQSADRAQKTTFWIFLGPSRCEEAFSHGTLRPGPQSRVRSSVICRA